MFLDFIGEVHSTYQPFIKENEQLLKNIFNTIPKPYHPHPPFTLRFLSGDLGRTQVIILGQDPYPNHLAATGRCFEVGNLYAWNQPFRQVSLKNIVRALFHCYTGEGPYTPFSQVRREIELGKFVLPAPDKLFASWEEQGVLLLNTSFTCETGRPGSHYAIWEPFTKRLIAYICEKNPTAAWFLWGSWAQSFSPIITAGRQYPSRHPMLCSPKYEDDFLKNPCFMETRDKIHWI